MITEMARKRKPAALKKPKSFILCPHEDSNLDFKLRRLALYPLNYGGVPDTAFFLEGFRGTLRLY